MGRLNLLLLEDDNDDADLIIKTLERSGMVFDHAIVCEMDGFLSAIQANQYNVILADNSLPGFDASTALKLVTQFKIDIPFILVTGSISEEFAVDIMKEGAWDYILKDRLQRLPNAILSAVNKYALEAERQKYLADVIKKESLMKEAERLAHFGSWEADFVRNIEQWSDENYRILGYEPGATVASFEKFLGHIHPDDLTFVKRAIDEAFLTKDRLKINCRLVSETGAVKFILCEMVFKRDGAGKPIYINGITRDITEARMAEDSLQKSEANLHTIFDNTETGYILLDTALTIVSINQQGYKFSVAQLQKPLSEGAPFLDFYSQDKKQVFNELLQGALNGYSVKHEIPFLQKDGTTKWYATGCHAVVNGDKKPLGVILSQTDITARKMMEFQEKMITADLVQRKNELEQFTFIISHNLRTPVANILGISNLLKCEGVEGTEKDFLLDGLTTSIEKLDAIIVDLNEIIQTRHSVNENKEVVYFENMVKDIIGSMSTIIKDKDVKFVCDFNEVGSMMTVKTYLHSIFLNLISNSIKYRQPNVPLEIKITSRKKEGGIELVFKDNGLGIDMTRKANQVFGLYKRFHAELAEGKGMGLFMVKTHVETLGGKIALKSEVNKGTEFTLNFEHKMSHHA